MADCCIIGCDNKATKRGEVKFYTLPTAKSSRPLKVKRRQLWLDAIEKANGTKEGLGQDAHICSAHFISGQMSLEISDQDFVPSVFPKQHSAKSRRKTLRPRTGALPETPKVSPKKRRSANENLNQSNDVIQPENNYCEPLEDEEITTENEIKKEVMEEETPQPLSSETNQYVKLKRPKLQFKPVVDDFGRFRCDLCNGKFLTGPALLKHKQLHEQEWSDEDETLPLVSDFELKSEYTENPNPVEEPVFQCNMCSRSFPSAHALKRHKLLHVRDLRKCPLCGTMFCKRHNHVVTQPQISTETNFEDAEMINTKESAESPSDGDDLDEDLELLLNSDSQTLEAIAAAQEPLESLTDPIQKKAPVITYNPRKPGLLTAFKSFLTKHKSNANAKKIKLIVRGKCMTSMQTTETCTSTTTTTTPPVTTTTPPGTTTTTPPVTTTITPPVTTITPPLSTSTPPVTTKTAPITITPPITTITPHVTTTACISTITAPTTITPPIRTITPHITTTTTASISIIPRFTTTPAPMTTITPPIRTITPHITTTTTTASISIIPRFTTTPAPMTTITPRITTITAPITNNNPPITSFTPRITTIAPRVTTVTAPVTRPIPSTSTSLIMASTSGMKAKSVPEPSSKANTLTTSTNTITPKPGKPIIIVPMKQPKTEQSTVCLSFSKPLPTNILQELMTFVSKSESVNSLTPPRLVAFTPKRDQVLAKQESKEVAPIIKPEPSTSPVHTPSLTEKLTLLPKQEQATFTITTPKSDPKTPPEIMKPPIQKPPLSKKTVPPVQSTIKSKKVRQTKTTLQEPYKRAYVHGSRPPSPEPILAKIKRGPWDSPIPNYPKGFIQPHLPQTPALPPALQMFSPQLLTSATLEVDRNFEYILSK